MAILNVDGDSAKLSYNIASKICLIKFNCAVVLHIPIVYAHDVSKQIPREKIFHRVENVIKQLIHTSAVRSSRYEALGKYGEHSIS